MGELGPGTADNRVRQLEAGRTEQLSAALDTARNRIVEVSNTTIRATDGRVEVSLGEPAVRRLLICWDASLGVVAFLGVCLLVALFTRNAGAREGIQAPGLLSAAYGLAACGWGWLAVSRRRRIRAEFGAPLVIDREHGVVRRGDTQLCSISDIEAVGVEVDKSERDNASAVWLPCRGGSRIVVAPRPFGYGAVYDRSLAELLATELGLPLVVVEADFSPV